MDEKLFAWHKKILAEIDLRLTNIFIADDPDALLAEEDLQGALQAQGFELFFYEDSISLRYFIEHQVKAKNGHCVISVDTDRYHADSLPFDILQTSNRISLSLGDCFPQLSAVVLKSLQPEELNVLDDALQQYTPGELNQSASSDFVLRHVFKLAPEILQSSSDLLRALLRLHFRDIEVPAILKNRLVSLLQKREEFIQWPLDQIVTEKKRFFSFLQKHWSDYVYKTLASINDDTEWQPEHSIILPFGHDDVRVYVDNLFLEGYLAPIEIDEPDKLAGHWCLAGILQNPEKERQKRITGLVKLCHDSLPATDDRHQHWLQFAWRWAELSALHHESGYASDEYQRLQQRIDAVFSEWLLARYASLHNHPPMPPVMLHHLPRAMARELESDDNAKSALILIDGLAVDQWITLREQLTEKTFAEAALFAWVPTVTSVSRQALFSAKPPYQFAKTIETTSSEPTAWRQFWLDHNLNVNQVYYEKGLGTDDVDQLIDRLSDQRFRAVGLVINTVDNMMHGMQLGASGMHNQVKQWAKTGYLNKLIDALLDYGFSIHITSDHGNVEAVGSGKVKEGAIAESRGERARVYKTETLRDTVSIPSEDVVNWPPIGLPADYLPKVMKGREAFVANGEKIVGHGGITIEEVIVPYVTLTRDIVES